MPRKMPKNILKIDNEKFQLTNTTTLEERIKNILEK